MDKLIRTDKKTYQGNPTCPICGNKGTWTSRLTYLYDQGQTQILECTGCGHLSLYPVPLINLTAREMSSIGDAELQGSALFKYLHRRFVIEPEINNVKKIIKNSSAARLLDIGCGTGWTTVIWRDHGFQVTGLEPSEARRNICQSTRQIETYGDYIETFTPKEKFDLVIMRHLFEHIEDPSSALRRIHDIFLKEDGILLIILPNINSIGRFLFQENWTWVLPWHLHFYNPRNLKRLLGQHGFQTLKIYQTPSPLWYPDCLRRIFGEEKRWTKIFTGKLRPLVTLLFAPIMAVGFLCNLNDNMTFIVQKK